MKILVSSILILLLSQYASAQQFSLYNTRTLFDSFENPSQKAFHADSSRKFAFNFFIPTVTFNSGFRGPSEASFKDFIFTDDTNTFPGIDEQGTNTVFANSNTYLLMFKLFKNLRHNVELGFSWQVREDASATATYEGLLLFRSSDRFKDNISGSLNGNDAFSQAYHQFSVSYREDLSRKLGVGAKLSALSGIAYSKFEINDSQITTIDGTANQLLLDGRYRSSFGLGQFEGRSAIPQFENPGVSITGSVNYRAPGGWFVLGTL